MTSKTISLRDSVYHRLLAERRRGESFSDVIDRLLGRSEPTFRDLVSALSPRDAGKAAAVLDDLRGRDVAALRRKYRA